MIVLEKTIELVCLNFKRFVMMLIMSIVCGLLLVLTLYFNEEYWYFEKETDRVMKKGIDKTYLINVPFNVESDNYYNTIQTVMDRYPDMIESVGMADVIVLDDEVTGICNIYSVELFNLELEKGNYYNQHNYPKEYDFIYYLGYNNNQYEVGEVIDLDSNGEHKALVAGRIKQGCRFPDLISIAGSETKAGIPSHSMDDMIIRVCCYTLDSGFPMAMTYNDRYTLDEVKGAFKEIGDENQCAINIASLRNMFDQLNYSNRDSIEVLNRLVIIVVFSVTILLTSTSIVSLLNNKPIYGVYIISGMKHKDIRNMIIIDSIIKCVITIATIISLALCYTKFIVPYEIFWQHMNAILYDYVFAKAVAIIIAVYVIITFVTVCVLNRMTPVKLVEEL